MRAAAEPTVRASSRRRRSGARKVEWGTWRSSLPRGHGHRTAGGAPRTGRPADDATAAPPPLPCRMRLSSALAIVVFSASAGCQLAPISPIAPTVTGSTRVLFVGNSLTYVHDVPALVTALARQAGDTGLVAASVAFPDFALEDHWNEGSALRAIKGQRWEFVVMQQGPSSLPENRAHLERWSGAFAPAIREAGGQPVLYQIWPHIQRRADAPAVRLSYANAAQAIGGRLAPAGTAWDSVLTIADPLPVYSSDGLHASPYGAWLAAVVLYATIREIDPRTLPAALPSMLPAPPLSADRVRTLLARAAQAMAGG